ncbi:hypothetical protein CEXT_722391 [Caerostris extrusa]|uniref:Uncharacterized protein n=1 Tax=Caerostris extrusa TaxID=172846 RepID=A0AAV4TMZ5_CAEEX|nr:hypothetical protein CEXT_722391 [Caerostris extrusa]
MSCYRRGKLTPPFSYCRISNNRTSTVFGKEVRWVRGVFRVLLRAIVECDRVLQLHINKLEDSNCLSEMHYKYCSNYYRFLSFLMTITITESLKWVRTSAIPHVLLLGERGIQTTISTGLLSRTAMTAINGSRDVACPTSPPRAFHNFDCKVARRIVPGGRLFWLSIVVAILFDRIVER